MLRSHVSKCQRACVLLPTQSSSYVTWTPALEVRSWKCHDMAKNSSYERREEGKTVMSDKTPASHTHMHAQQDTRGFFHMCATHTHTHATFDIRGLLVLVDFRWQPHLWRWLCFGSRLVTLRERRQEKCPRQKLALFSPAVCPFVIGQNTRRPVAICHFE